jgi:hypothetical protein
MTALCLTAVACGVEPAVQSGPPPQGASAYRAAVLADGPIGYWRLDETHGVRAYDQSATGSHGTIEAVVALQQPGATGDGDAAMQLNGTGRIFVPDNPSLQVKSGNLTLEAFVKPSQIKAGLSIILCKGRAGIQTEYCLGLLAGRVAYQSVAEQYVSSSEPLPVDRWSHIAITIAGNATGRFYVNGVAAGTFSTTSNHLVTAAELPVCIGAEAAMTDGWFFGAIDEAAIYNHTLTAERLGQHVEAAAQKAAATTRPQ